MKSIIDTSLLLIYSIIFIIFGLAGLGIIPNSWIERIPFWLFIIFVISFFVYIIVFRNGSDSKEDIKKSKN